MTLVPLSWSPAIRAALVAALPPQALADAFGLEPEEGGAELEELRALLGEEAEQDPARRAWLWSCWRRAQGALVDTLARLFAGRSRLQLRELLRDHGAATLALAVLSEPGEEPEELVDEALAQLPGPADRKALRAALDHWLAPAQPDPPIEGRLLVIGGHPRERTRVQALLGPLARELKWIPAVKGAGRGEAQLALSAVCPTDTMLIVTGRVGHSIMHSARKAADAQGATCLFVEQLTELQTRRLHDELRDAGAG